MITAQIFTDLKELLFSAKSCGFYSICIVGKCPHHRNYYHNKKPYIGFLQKAKINSFLGIFLSNCKEGNPVKYINHKYMAFLTYTV